jgi:hypothetical protein
MKGSFHTLIVISMLAFSLPGYGQGNHNWQDFSVLGFEQAGASSTQADQRFFFDYYITRPLPFGANVVSTNTDPKIAAKENVYGAFKKMTHWWGNVRLASYPQQINAPVGEFLSGLSGNVADVKVNEFVQAAEFRTGIDVKIVANDTGSRLSAFAGFGGVGPMDPKQTVSVFKVPDAPAAGQAESINRRQFFERYPKGTFPGLEDATYVAFSNPDRGRFYRQYAAGLRYTQIRTDADNNLAPASISASFGQHELISRGRAVGVVGVFEAFVPFKLGDTPAYIFGRALMSIRRTNDVRPVFLETAIADNQPVPPTAAGVYVISAAADRDVYTVGIGLDPLQIFKKR